MQLLAALFYLEHALLLNEQNEKLLLGKSVWWGPGLKFSLSELTEKVTS